MNDSTQCLVKWPLHLSMNLHVGSYAWYHVFILAQSQSAICRQNCCHTSSRMAVALDQLLQMKQNLFYVTIQLQEIIYFIYISCIVASDMVHVAALLWTQGVRISNVICDFFWNEYMSLLTGKR